MKKIISLIITALLAVSMIVPAYADAVPVTSRRVVTIGINNSPAQEASILRYFGVSAEDVQIIYVNNQQERDYLGSYVPLEQIGTQTFSCSYVKPTKEGGIKVKTANLNWVTCNMIASTLSTCGVNNCQVIAAAPFEVSGTGALTGIIIAYQQASNTTLAPEKVDLANREMIVTANLSDQVGSSNAIAVVNEAKLEAIENNITNIEEITTIVNNISNEYNINIDNDQTEIISSLVSDIAQQQYEIEGLKKTLASVQANVIEDTNAPEEVQQQVVERKEEIDEQEELEKLENAFDENGEIETEEDNILDNTDASALSSEDNKVEESDTLSTVTEQESAAAEDEDDGWEVFGGDDFDAPEDISGDADPEDIIVPENPGEIVTEPAEVPEGPEEIETESELKYTEDDFAYDHNLTERYDLYKEVKDALEDSIDDICFEDHSIDRESLEESVKAILDCIVNIEMDGDFLKELKDAKDDPQYEFEKSDYRREYKDEEESDFMTAVEEIVFEILSENEELTDAQKESVYETIMDTMEKIYMPEEEMEEAPFEEFNESEDIFEDGDFEEFDFQEEYVEE